MGLLSNDLIEQEFAVFDHIFKLYSWDTNPAVGIKRPWETLEKPALIQLLRNIDLVTDDKGRLRLDKEQLLEMVLKHMINPEKVGMILGNKPVVGISSTATHVYYVINTKYKMFDEWFSTSNMVARITLEKINPGQN